MFRHSTTTNFKISHNAILCSFSKDGSCIPYGCTERCLYMLQEGGHALRILGLAFGVLRARDPVGQATLPKQTCSLTWSLVLPNNQYLSIWYIASVLVVQVLGKYNMISGLLGPLVFVHAAWESVAFRSVPRGLQRLVGCRALLVLHLPLHNIKPIKPPPPPRTSPPSNIKYPQHL